MRNKIAKIIEDDLYSLVSSANDPDIYLWMADKIIAATSGNNCNHPVVLSVAHGYTCKSCNKFIEAGPSSLKGE